MAMESVNTGSMRSLSALFDSRADAERAVQALVSEAGVDRSGVRLDPGAGVTDAGYDASNPHGEKGFFAALKDIFVPDEDRYAYAEGLRRGGTLASGMAYQALFSVFAALLVFFSVIGLVLGLWLHPDVPLWMQPYLPIAVIAALDALFGGIRAALDGLFDDKVFVVSFLSNVVVAAFIVFLGDQLGVGNQLSTGVVVVLGLRIFTNVASIRRHVFKA